MSFGRMHFNLGKGWRKVWFYAGNFVQYAVPNYWFRVRLNRILHSLPEADRVEADRRVDYYNRVAAGRGCVAQGVGTSVADFKYPRKKKHKFVTYFFDLYKCVRYFDVRLRFAYEFGDVTEEPVVPSFVKSRRITAASEPTNAVILKLNSVRHFYFVKDKIPFAKKKDMLVSRNIVRQPQRRQLLEMYHGNPMFDIGQINSDSNGEHPEWVKPYMTIPEQLEYKFICCIEGNDVATNLKWVMSSNSLAVMPRPKYETWFMEGKLIGDYHYVLINDDYSDLEEKMNYYISHPDEAEAIISHAHEYVAKFADKKVERYVSLKVVQRYFERTNQLSHDGQA